MNSVYCVTSAEVQQPSDTYLVHYRFICKLHGHRMVMKSFISFIFITCCKRLCKRDRGGKGTWLRVLKWIKDCNYQSCQNFNLILPSQYSSCSIIPVTQGTPVSTSPSSACTGWQSMEMWRHWGWSYQRGIDVLDGQEPVIDAVHLLILHPALSERKHRLLGNSIPHQLSECKTQAEDKTRIFLFLFSLAEHCVCQPLYSDTFSVLCRHSFLPTLISH